MQDTNCKAIELLQETAKYLIARHIEHDDICKYETELTKNILSFLHPKKEHHAKTRSDQKRVEAKKNRPPGTGGRYRNHPCVSHADAQRLGATQRQLRKGDP